MAKHILNTDNPLIEYDDSTLIYKPNVTGNLEMLSLTGYTSETTKTLSELSSELYNGNGLWCSGEDLVDPKQFKFIAFRDFSLATPGDILKARTECNRPPELSYNGVTGIFEDTDVDGSFQYDATIDVDVGTSISSTFIYTMQFTQGVYQDYTFNDISYIDPINGKETTLDPLVITYNETNVGQVTIYSNGVDEDVSVDYVGGVPTVGDLKFHDNLYAYLTHPTVTLANMWPLEITFTPRENPTTEGYILSLMDIGPGGEDVGQDIKLRIMNGNTLSFVVDDSAGSSVYSYTQSINLGQEYKLRVDYTGGNVVLELDDVEKDSTATTFATTEFSTLCIAGRARAIPELFLDVDVKSFSVNNIDSFDCQTRLWSNGDVDAYKVIGSINSRELDIIETEGTSSKNTVFPYLNNDPNQWYSISE